MVYGDTVAATVLIVPYDDEDNVESVETHF